jgi:PAS domain S-box-containing protein
VDERREQFEQLRRDAEESRARLEELGREAKAELEQAARTREEVESAQRQTSEALARVEEMRREADSARADADEARQEAAKAREDAGEARDLLARLHGEAKEALSRAEEGRTGAEVASGEIKAARSNLEDVRALAGEALGELQQARAEAEEARRSADEARARAEQAQAEAELARRAAYEALEQASGAWDGYGSADRSRFTRMPASGHVELPPVRESPRFEPPSRPRREGFDDMPVPMATIDLDGHFRELNYRFSELVGYSEKDFHHTLWPSVVDRDLLQDHRRLMDEMRAGQLGWTTWETSYVHEQGLLVHMVGRLSVERDEDGEPAGFLFVVDTDPAV